MKRRILKSVAEEIQVTGLRFKLDDIAQNIGISKKTIYAHFDSKAAIIDSIVTQVITETDEKTNAIFSDQHLSVVEKIKQLMLVMPEYYQIYDRPVLDEMKRYYPEEWQAVHDSLEEDWNDLEEFINGAVIKGELVTDYHIAIIMKILRDAFQMTFDQRFFKQNNITVEEGLTEVIDIFLFGIIPRKK
ncbi:TetR family transcriptional regulator [Paraliobacillus quinghaiensis]|uniref:TetR family transcriptional regulator n=1 Tax=Paraliobacillus quinghaiensis TaxID=470815 RepID=A0A917TR05_9BACI|nr:TetR/AcrR family transcriptional regulator [Paraliobacillus quinghaiensis]GGM34062.1 TetR family transcriptional regulator [Paraliobacillus quinghaiensis]